MKLKYEEKIASFQPCPNKTHPVEEAFVAYRFSHNPVDTEENFLPIAVRDISRITGKTRGHCCSAYGLSMFETVEQLQEKFRKLVEFNPLVRQSLGSLWVGVKIDKKSGSITPPDKYGHFNLHEAVEFKGRDVVVAVGDIA